MKQLERKRLWNKSFITAWGLSQSTGLTNLPRRNLTSWPRHQPETQCSSSQLVRLENDTASSATSALVPLVGFGVRCRKRFFSCLCKVGKRLAALSQSLGFRCQLQLVLESLDVLLQLLCFPFGCHFGLESVQIVENHLKKRSREDKKL